jgi:hypothetical protein
LYNTKYIPNSGDLYLVIGSISFNADLKLSNSTWELTAPDNRKYYAWQAFPLPTDPQNASIPMSLALVLNERVWKIRGGPTIAIAKSDCSDGKLFADLDAAFRHTNSSRC